VAALCLNSGAVQMFDSGFILQNYTHCMPLLNLQVCFSMRVSFSAILNPHASSWTHLGCNVDSDTWDRLSVIKDRYEQQYSGMMNTGKTHNVNV